MKSIIASLQRTAKSLRIELEKVESALNALSGKSTKSPKRKFKMSAKGRAAIRRAQKLRWAKIKRQKK